MVHIKSAAEIERMRPACILAAQTLKMIEPHLRAGMSTNDINDLVHQFIIDHDAYPSPLNYHGFPKSVCTSVNHVVCHGIPSDKRLRTGDIINIDVTVYLNGYHGDTSCTYFIGEPTPRARKVTEVAKKCLQLGIDCVKPGAYLGDIGHAIQSYAEAQNCSVVREYCGHGIGKAFHEEPQIVHYGKPGTGLRLQEGMVFTIEPMINIGKAAIKVLNDDWTVVTRDKSLSAQFEHTMCVTPTGVEVLTVC